MKKKSEITVLKCEGTHSEMGRTQGEFCSGQLAQAREIMLKCEELGVMKPGWMPAGLFLAIAKSIKFKEFATDIEKYVPKQYERLKAISEGANFDFKLLMLLASMEVSLASMDFFLQACSAAAVSPGRSVSGEPMIAKNFDYPPHFTTTDITRYDKPASGYAIIGASNAPLAGYHDAINEHGLTITYNYGYGQDKLQYRVPLSMIIQEVLENCRTTAEAVDMVKSLKHGGGGIWMVGDASGDMRALEISHTMVEERMPENGLLFHTNHYLTPKMQKIDVPQTAFYTKKTVKALIGCNCRKSSDVRWARGVELLSKKDRIADTDLMAVMADHGPAGSPSDETICRHSNYYETTCSMVFYPTRKKMKILYGYPCQNEYSELGF